MIVTDVRRKCFGARSKIRRLRDVLPVDTKKKLYDGFVLLHLDYCCVLWHECSKELQRRVDRIHNYGMRLILLKLLRTPSEGLRQKLKWTHLSNPVVLLGSCFKLPSSVFVAYRKSFN